MCLGNFTYHGVCSFGRVIFAFLCFNIEGVFEAVEIHLGSGFSLGLVEGEVAGNGFIHFRAEACHFVFVAHCGCSFSLGSGSFGHCSESSICYFGVPRL